VDLFLYRPVLMGMWKQRELSDGTYDADDLFSINELLDFRDSMVQK